MDCSFVYVVPVVISGLYAWQQTKVIVLIRDVNDNAPRFEYPPYPQPENTARKYFGAIAADADPFSLVLSIYVSIGISLTLSMLRLLSSKAQGCKDLEYHLNPVMLVFIGKLLLSTLLPGFQSFFMFFA